MITIISFITILYLARDIMDSFSNDAVLIFLGICILSLANESKK